MRFVSLFVFRNIIAEETVYKHPIALARRDFYYYYDSITLIDSVIPIGPTAIRRHRICYICVHIYILLLSLCQAYGYYQFNSVLSLLHYGVSLMCTLAPGHQFQALQSLPATEDLAEPWLLTGVGGGHRVITQGTIQDSCSQSGVGVWPDILDRQASPYSISSYTHDI